MVIFFDFHLYTLSIFGHFWVQNSQNTTFLDRTRLLGRGKGSSLFLRVPTTSVGCIESVLLVVSHNIGQKRGKKTAKIAKNDQKSPKMTKNTTFWDITQHLRRVMGSGLVLSVPNTSVVYLE